MRQVEGKEAILMSTPDCVGKRFSQSIRCQAQNGDFGVLVAEKVNEMTNYPVPRLVSRQARDRDRNNFISRMTATSAGEFRTGLGSSSSNVGEFISFASLDTQHALINT